MSDVKSRYMSRQRYALKRLRECLDKGRKIRVGFSLVFDSVFPLRKIYELMRGDDLFEPFLIVIPDVSRGLDNMLACYQRSCISLRAQYPGARIIQALDPARLALHEFFDECDLYCPANPYDSINPAQLRNDHFYKRRIPVFYGNYGVCVTRAALATLAQNPAFINFWRFYACTREEMAAWPMPENARLAGFAMLDDLQYKLFIAQKEQRGRKRIIIAPHHTIRAGANNIFLGQFLKYADLFQRLPMLYPQYDFIFRPHPILRHNLNILWGQSATDAWFEQMAANGNVEMSETGDFLDVFAQSDAMIHDCGSFMAYYMFAHKPACYMLTAPGASGQFSQLGKECLKAHVNAFSERDILAFLDDMALGADPLRAEREELLGSIAVNYPLCSQFILNDLRQSVLAAQ